MYCQQNHQYTTAKNWININSNLESVLCIFGWQQDLISVDIKWDAFILAFWSFRCPHRKTRNLEPFWYMGVAFRCFVCIFQAITSCNGFSPSIKRSQRRAVLQDYVYSTKELLPSKIQFNNFLNSFFNFISVINVFTLRFHQKVQEIFCEM